MLTKPIFKQNNGLLKKIKLSIKQLNCTVKKKIHGIKFLITWMVNLHINATKDGLNI